MFVHLERSVGFLLHHLRAALVVLTSPGIVCQEPPVTKFKSMVVGQTLGIIRRIRTPAYPQVRVIRTVYVQETELESDRKRVL